MWKNKKYNYMKKNLFKIIEKCLSVRAKSRTGVHIVLLLLVGFSTKLFSQETPTLETYTLKNGVKIYLMQYGKIPAVNVRFIINSGKKNETPGQQGYSEITASMLLRGNTKYTEEAQNDLAFKL